MPPCIHKSADRYKIVILMIPIPYSLELFTGRWPNVGLHVKNKIYFKTNSAVHFVTSHFAD